MSTGTVRTILRPGPVVTRAQWPQGQVRSVHVVRIGGAGMSAVARLALGAGLAVSGSDSQDGQFIAPPRAAGARIGIGFDAGLLAADCDVVIVSTAVRADNPEVVAAHGRGIPVVHRAAALAGLLHDRDLAAVAGTHGKTTTTAMLTSALRGAGEDPAWALGAAVPDLVHNAGWGAPDGELAVVEADESDGSLLAFAPHVVVVTNQEPDHLDFHGTPENVTAVFDAFVERIRPLGTLVVCADDDGARALGRRAAERGVRVETYGARAGETWSIAEESHDGTGTAVTFRTPAGEVSTVLAVAGHHNVLNALGALAGAHALRPRADLTHLLAGIAGFRGASRRFEPRGTVDGIRVYDDYAHHPREVAATIAAARGIVGDGRVLAVFQPHLFSRTRAFAADFARALGTADLALVLPVYAAREDPDPATTARTITEHAEAGSHLRALDDRAEAAPAVARAARPGDIVLVLGAGDVVEETPAILARLTRATS